MTKILLSLGICLLFINGYAQQKKATFKDQVVYVKEIPSLASRTNLIPSSDEVKEFNPKTKGTNRVVPGKGFPKWGQMDPLARQQQKSKSSRIGGFAPLLTFEAASSGSTPTDPTGAVGPNHYINAWNSSFAIYDKAGNVLMPASSLANLWPGETTGDPIVFYDNFAERFLITQFDGRSGSTDPDNGFLIAVCQGDDPVNDGWFTYRFRTGNTFPDYPKFSVWSDGYYITCNKDSNSAGTSEVVYALERDKLLVGDTTAQIIGFPLPNIDTSGFFSPAGFNAIGAELPPVGNKPIIYLRDDEWQGVNDDALKMWNINVDWTTPANSTIAELQEFTTGNGDITPFNSVFNGGSFINLEQPSGPNIDALQATIMYMTNYRRFETYNAAVLNFAVDLNGDDRTAAIRWYELRQNGDGQPWTVYQEGTYVQPDGDSAFAGAMGIDKFGNIALAYSVVSPTTFPSLRYTGRFASDELGEMTITEEVVVNGQQSNPNTRYGDYSQTTIDPTDDTTFWYIGEYFAEGKRKNQVGVFTFKNDTPADVGVVAIVSPSTGTLSDSEQITVEVRNFGTEEQSDVPVNISIDGGTAVTGVIPSIPVDSALEFTFSETFDLSVTGTIYSITSSTQLTEDTNNDNDAFTAEVQNVASKDVGVVAIDAPITGTGLGQENVTVVVENFGGEAQSSFDVVFRVNGANAVTETYNETLNPGQNATFSFTGSADLSATGVYEICSATSLSDDADTDNDEFCKTLGNLNCIPVSTGTTPTNGCSSDGVKNFVLADISNQSGCGTDNGAVGYSDFLNISTDLLRSFDDGNGIGVYTVSIRSDFNNEVASIWIDFNDNYLFEEEEQLLSGGVIPTAGVDQDFQIAIPEDAPLGNHILRVKAIDPAGTGTGIDDPCGNVQWGETEDYLVNITDNVLNVDQLALENSEFSVVSSDKNQFTVSLKTTVKEPIIITVHNMLGQTVIANRMSNNNGTYEYPLDMSYAATGFYLIRVGIGNYGLVKKIVVQ